MYKGSSEEIEFVGAISTLVWKQIVQRHLTSEFRIMITEGIVPLEAWLDRNKIHGRVYRYSELEQYELDRAFNLELAGNLIESGDIKLIGPILANVEMGEEKRRVDDLMKSFE